jgi:hypothetical protein
MKAVLGVVLAGTVAVGAAGLSAFGFRLSEPRETGSAPAAAVLATGENPIGDRQEREEVFEFTQKPTVTKQGDKVIIAFASKGKCDATVAIVGPDGKIVRHLASGVLGKNAPWPFKQDSLSQSLEWDGRDDVGKPAPAGCKVKVALGLKPELDKLFASANNQSGVQNPATFGYGINGYSMGLTVDKDGGLYVIGHRLVMRYSRDGKYERTLLPPPATVATPEKFSGPGLSVQETVWGDKVIAQRSSWGAFTEFSQNEDMGNLNSVYGPALGPDGRLAVTYMRGYNKPTILVLFNKDGSVPPGSAMNFAGFDGYEEALFGPPADGNKFRATGYAHHMAASPDGEWLYIGMVGHSVCRIRWKDVNGPSMAKPGIGDRRQTPLVDKLIVLETFKGVRNKSGNDNEHFGVPAGIAFDPEGNVLIADPSNNRIQVFKPDRTYLGTVAVACPQRIEVHPKTGAIYAMSWSNNAAPVVLRKFSGWKEGKEVASLTMEPLRHVRNDNATWAFNTFALDATAEPASLWVWGKDGLCKVTDKGTSFEKGASLGSASPPPDLTTLAGRMHGADLFGGAGPRMVADSEREEVYVGNSGGGPTLRANGHTGKIDPSFKKAGADVALGPDGLIYTRTGSGACFVVRYTRDGQPVPFKHGLKINLRPDGTEANGYNAGDCRSTYPPADGNYTAIFVGSTSSSKVWQPGLAVAANGDIWVGTCDLRPSFSNALFDDQGNHVPWETFVDKTDWTEVLASRAPVKDAVRKKPGSGWSMLMVWDRDGNLKCGEVFENMSKGQGLRVDRHGSIYFINDFAFTDKGIRNANMESLKNLSKGQVLGVDMNGKSFLFNATDSQAANMLVKVTPKGSWPWGRVLPAGAKPTLPGLVNLQQRRHQVEGVTWAVANVDDCLSGGCQCHMFFFDLDKFARSYLPCNAIHSVLVYDANGNMVARIGRYGNVDSAGPGSLVPEPAIAFNHVRTVCVSDEALYVVDGGNQRIVRCALSYAAEETVPLP